MLMKMELYWLVSGSIYPNDTDDLRIIDCPDLGYYRIV